MDQLQKQTLFDKELSTFLSQKLNLSNGELQKVLLLTKFRGLVEVLSGNTSVPNGIPVSKIISEYLDALDLIQEAVSARVQHSNLAYAGLKVPKRTISVALISAFLGDALPRFDEIENLLKDYRDRLAPFRAETSDDTLDAMVEISSHEDSLKIMQALRGASKRMATLTYGFAPSAETMNAPGIAL